MSDRKGIDIETDSAAAVAPALWIREAGCTSGEVMAGGSVVNMSQT